MEIVAYTISNKYTNKLGYWADYLLYCLDAKGAL